MGHDSPAAALIYQHSSRASDEAIAAAVDARLAARLQSVERKPGNGAGARVGPRNVAPARGQYRLVCAGQGRCVGADDGNRTRTVSLGS
jgi:hypothetical protein